MWSTASLTKPGFTALTRAKAPLTASPVRPPFESTSSLMSCTQSAITFGRVPGTSRISFSVGMAGNLAPLRTGVRVIRMSPYGPSGNPPLPPRRAVDPDGAELPELHRPVHPGRHPAHDPHAARPVGRQGRLAA